MLQALLIGAGVLLCSVLCYALATALIVGTVVRVLPGDHGELGFWRSVGIMKIVTLITAVTHLIEIALWAIVLLRAVVHADPFMQIASRRGLPKRVVPGDHFIK
jgi:hypothetical protein